MMYEYYGIDINASATHKAAAAYKAFSNMHFLCADIRTRPFGENFFDQVLFAGTAHHLTDEQFSAAIVELHRCLKPGAVLHIIDPVRQPADGWQAKLLRFLDQGRHCRTIEQIKELVHSCSGFELGVATLH